MPQLLQKNSLLQQFYFSKSEMDKLLIISCLFSLCMMMIRLLVTGKVLFLFLPWNLFLAYIPYYISSRLQLRPDWIAHKGKFALLLLIWLLFLPNSFYILTDLFHLELREESNRWFDLTLIFSFAWNGILLGILSVRQMERIFNLSVGIKNEFFFLYPVMWLNALGIYIGRYMRFNSWDVITDPFQLIGEISMMLIHPFRNFFAWGMIGCFSVLMTIVYISLKRIGKAMP
ncbi:MAG TPA: DUF1361 domain-containing protein [Chitinophagaceae bacterium]